MYGGDRGRLIDAERYHPVGIEHHLILLHHAADRGHFGHPGNGLQLVAQEPVLDAAQIRQIVLAGAIDQRIFVNPADPGRVGAKLRCHAVGQIALNLAEIFQHPRTGPIKIGAVLEQDIDIAVAIERIAAHGTRARHRKHGGGEGIGHLIFDDLRRLARIGRANDDLHVRQVGQCVDRRAAHRPNPGGKQHRHEQQHQHTAPNAGANDFLDHRVGLARASPCGIAMPSICAPPVLPPPTLLLSIDCPACSIGRT